MGLLCFSFSFGCFFFLSCARGVAFLQVESGGAALCFGWFASHFPFVLFSVECCCKFGCFVCLFVYFLVALHLYIWGNIVLNTCMAFVVIKIVSLVVFRLFVCQRLFDKIF